MVNSSIYLMLQEFEILNRLNRSEMESLSKVITLQRYDKHATIYAKGQDNQYVYIVKKGAVKLSIRGEETRSMIKDIIYEGDLVGENIFAGSDKRSECATALQETYLLKIPVAAFSKKVELNPDFAQDVMNLMIRRLATLEERVHSYIFKKADRRIVDFVKQMGQRRGKETEANEVILQHTMSHKEIARYTDTSRQTVTRVFSQLKRDKIIHFNDRKPNKITIHDMMALA